MPRAKVHSTPPFLVADILRMARGVAAHLARRLPVQLRTFSLSRCKSNVVEKLASSMMAEREKLLENMHATSVPAQRIKDLEAVHKAWTAWSERMRSLQETQ